MAGSRLPKYMRKISGCYFYVVGRDIRKPLGTDFKRALVNYLRLRGPDCPTDVRDKVTECYLRASHG